MIVSDDHASLVSENLGLKLFKLFVLKLFKLFVCNLFCLDFNVNLLMFYEFKGFRISRMTTTTTALHQSFNSNWLDKDGCHSHSCKRFQRLSIGSPSVSVRGNNKERNNSLRLSRLYAFHSSKYQAARLSPISSTSSIKNHSYSSQTAESE